MSFKSIVRELREMKDGIGNVSRRAVMKDGIGNVSRRGVEGKHWRNRTRSHIAPDVAVCELVEQGKWANLPPELLLDIIRRVEESETSWPARSVVVYCGSVCKSWRDITKEIVKTPEVCGRLTFPISLKQPGPRDSPIQCFIRRDRATSTYLLYFGLTPSTTERSFSAMSFVKNKLRNKMDDGYLTDCLILYIEKEIARTINVDSIIDDFRDLKERRSLF